MKLTIEPTNPTNASRHFPQVKVEVTHPHDDLTLHQMFTLAADAFMAMGYSPESVREYVEETGE